MSADNKVVAVVPVFNEEDTIRETVRNLNNIDIIDSIVVVNDGSTDNTANVVKELNVNFINLEKNKGKGYAIKEAIQQFDFDYLVLVDGDLGNTSSEIEKLIYPVINDEADVTIAKFPKPLKKGGFGFVKNLAKNGVYFYTGKKLDTTLSGQRVYKKQVVDKVDYIPNRFGIEVAMTVGTLRKGYSIKEVEVNMRHRETGRSVKDFVHRGKQFINILWTLIVLFFRR
ncbi:glycosyltransferase family 2 protein [Anaerosalibacter sp. Marseille-P3206]|uniref:glycosyltransferase family 2 protein n=1 Tax=Anaerosalibacter sp. Marseille-P3206 TaxID=1871005 RepID=UPI00098467EB|nr:glycosyltransferase family 2 protein [Anaerosalibacter sp. Marseille-P3206]